MAVLVVRFYSQKWYYSYVKDRKISVPLISTL